MNGNDLHPGVVLIQETFCTYCYNGHIKYHYQPVDQDII